MIQHYRQMVDDPLRIDAFSRAIRAVVRPGDVVVDAGCGLGTYAVLACRAGASRVYAVDSAPILEAAREVVRHNGCADRVTLLSGRTTHIEPPERAQVVIFEDYQAGLFVPATFAVVRDLATRWLAPGGVLLPGRARLLVAPVEDAEGHAAIDRLRAHDEHVAGVDFAPTRRRAFASLHSRRLAPGALLAAHAEAARIDLSAPAPSISWRGDTVALRDGLVHGLLVWFELELGDERLDTGPLASSSAWNQTILPFDPPLPVARGTTLCMTLDAAALGDAPLWRWRLDADSRSATNDSMAGLLLRPDTLALSRPDRVPVESKELVIDRFVLERVDGARRLDEIADALATRFPARFATPADARARVVEVVSRYT